MVGGGIKEDALFRGSKRPGTTGLAFGVVGSSVESPFSIEGTSAGVIIDTSDEGDMQKGETFSRRQDKGARTGRAVGTVDGVDQSQKFQLSSPPTIQTQQRHARRRNVGRTRYLVAS